MHDILSINTKNEIYLMLEKYKLFTYNKTQILKSKQLFNLNSVNGIDSENGRFVGNRDPIKHAYEE